MREGSAVSMQQRDWPLSWLRDTLGIEPRDASLFRMALTHRSAAGENNERLEFLGDAVLNLVVAEHLYGLFPRADEGSLSRLRARIVSSQPLGEVGAALGLGDVLSMGSGELRSGGFRRESILADATEALLGALFLDAGLAPARALVLKLFASRLALLNTDEELKDAKTRLQELLQSRGLTLPGYVLERAEGEPHEQTFWVRCDVQLSGATQSGAHVTASGSGSSRRRAEQQAAEIVLERLSVLKDL